jgi:transposase
MQPPLGRTSRQRRSGRQRGIARLASDLTNYTHVRNRSLRKMRHDRYASCTSHWTPSSAGSFFRSLSIEVGQAVRIPPCLVGIEACASSHHWSRQLQALGHTVRLMPPAYVKPYVKRQKNDAADAEAICEAVTRPNMRSCRPRRPSSKAA